MVAPRGTWQITPPSPPPFLPHPPSPSRCRQLRVACASRDLDQIGTRAELIDRILQQQRRDLKRIARAEAMDKLRKERIGEAQGSVYAVGQGYGPEFHSWDRLFVRGNLSVLQALCGRGVVQVTAVRCEGRKQGGSRGMFLPITLSSSRYTLYAGF